MVVVTCLLVFYCIKQSNQSHRKYVLHLQCFMKVLHIPRTKTEHSKMSSPITSTFKYTAQPWGFFLCVFFVVVPLFCCCCCFSGCQCKGKKNTKFMSFRCLGFVCVSNTFVVNSSIKRVKWSLKYIVQTDKGKALQSYFESAEYLEPPPF